MWRNWPCTPMICVIMFISLFPREAAILFCRPFTVWGSTELYVPSSDWLSCTYVLPLFKLQYTVVTPNGKVVVANKCQNSDLFWALRGGGGGTFGVVLDSTHKVEPNFSFSRSVASSNL
jgi:hypothetical protein